MITGLFAAGLSIGVPSAASAQFYEQHNLVSDGAVPADHAADTDLVNPWGLAATGTSPWWVSDNGTNKSTLYNGNTGVKAGLVVNVPGHPTGIVFNPGTGFAVPGHNKSLFIFATEDGTIAGWPGSGTAVFEFPNVPGGAVYKGLAFAHTATADYIYAANFHAGTVDVFDSTFTAVMGGFRDPSIPVGFAPFGIQNLGNTIYVTYAMQDADAHDDVRGEGNGYINAFDISGHLLRRVASKGELNSPWGLALAPAGFGKFSGDLLVGNFGDGRIHAFDPRPAEGQFPAVGLLHSTAGRPIEIDGLWALAFGNGGSAGPATTLFFTAGPLDEEHGLFGSLVVAGPPGHEKHDK
jgi:uncharacterized protein (TIGR03118 family)